MRILLPVVLSCLLWLTTSSTFAQTSFSGAQVKDIEQIVHDYLIQNPEVLAAASEALQVKEEKNRQDSSESAIVENKSALFNDPNSPVLGNWDGDVILVEFFDYQCSHCKTMADTIDDIKQSHPQLKIIFKMLPLFGNNSEIAARAALATQDGVSNEQFFKFHNALFKEANVLNEKRILAVAKANGINLSQMTSQMQSEKINQELKMDYDLAKALRLVGTPTIILANKELTKFKFIVGAVGKAELQKNIDALKTVAPVVQSPVVSQSPASPTPLKTK
jgi:protein-disulfide isomerase